MLNVRKVWEDLWWVGGSDRRISRFENYIPLNEGVSYNSYLLLDDKTVLFDTVDSSVVHNWFNHVELALDGRPLDYLIVHHMEPDHCAGIVEILAKHPNCTLIGNVKTLQFLKQFHRFDVTDRACVIKEGDVLETGRHHLEFVFAPNVHWPEVFMTYDRENKALFSADAFGSFRAVGGNIFSDEVDYEHDFMDEARRYYLNIVGKQGASVMKLFKKLEGRELKELLPLHGLIFRGEGVATMLQKYQTWASFEPEERGVVIVYASMYGNMAEAADALALKLAERGVRGIKMYDVSQTSLSQILSECFRYSHAVFACINYCTELYYNMHSLLHELKLSNYKNRSFALMVSKSWGGKAKERALELLEACPNLVQIGETLEILTRLLPEQEQDLDALAEAIASDVLIK